MNLWGYEKRRFSIGGEINSFANYCKVCWFRTLFSMAVWCSQMNVFQIFDFLFVPHTRLPETVHFVVNFFGVVIGDNLPNALQFINIIYCFK